MLFVLRCNSFQIVYILLYFCCLGNGDFCNHSDCTKRFSETNNIKMLEFLIDNIFVIFGESVFQQTVGKPMSRNLCSSSCRLVPLFVRGILYIGPLKKNEKKMTRSFNFTFRYIDDVLSLNNSRFSDFVNRIYPIELEIKDTTDTARAASYLELHLKIDGEDRLRTKLYYYFPSANFPFICSHIPAALAYGVYISQLIRYSRACGSYHDFLDRGLCKQLCY
jgi:hypothetical protein